MKVAYYPIARTGVAQIGLVALFLLSIAAQAPTLQKTAGDVSSPPQVLELGKTLSGQMRGGESHEYRFVLAAGQYAHIEIDQKSIDLAFAAYAPDGQQIIEGNVTYPGELEKVSVIGAGNGAYRLRVWPQDQIAPVGNYEIKLTDLQQASQVHKDRVAAEYAIAAAMTMYRQQTAQAQRDAIAKYNEALDHWRAAKDAEEESLALTTIGAFHNGLGEKEKALELINEGLKVARANGDQSGEGWALESLASVYENFGDKKLAVEVFEQALPLLRATHHRHGEMGVLNGLGMIQYALGEKQKALSFFHQAAELCHELNNLVAEASLLNNLGMTYGDLGDNRKYLEMENAALAVRRRISDRSGEGVVLNNIGAAYSNLSDYQKAMDAYTDSLNIARDLGQPLEEALRLNNLAWLYSTIGDDENARRHYAESVAILRRIKDQWRLAQALTNLGATYAALHDYNKALELYAEALPLHRSGGNKRGIANTLNNTGFAYSKLGDREKALDYYSQGVALLRSSGDQRLLAQGLRSMGVISRNMGDRQKAIEYVDEGLKVSRSIGDRRGEAESLGEIAHLDLDTGNLDAARHHCEEAFAIFDSLRSTITNPSLRAWFSQAGRKVYEVNLQALLRLHEQQPNPGYDGAALVAMEKARARSLLEILGESQARIREGVDPALLDQEISLRRTIAGKAQVQERLLAGKHSDEQAAAAAKELDSLTREYDQLQSSIRKQNPAYAALTMPVPLTLAEIRSKVLDPETVLLEYSLGEEKSFLFAVTPQAIDVFELPKRETVEAASRRLYDLLIARNASVPGETAQQRMVRIRQTDAAYRPAAAELSRMVLGPVARKLGGKRLLIVAEGALQYVPFGALPDPQTNAKAEPLLVAHEIVTAPSASVLAIIRADVARRKPAEKVLAVLADPVFDSDDARLAQQGKALPVNTAGKVASSEVTRSASESGVQRFERLRFSRREAEQIARLVNGADKFTALDFAASRTTATSTKLTQYRIVHFATHGVINNQHPELSGLVLSLVNEKGEPVDGFLRLYDIYNLKLGADLVVLSACQTALGKDMAAEGLIGLTRGFVYAGAPRVVASLWRIDDRVTAELMGNFYSSMMTRGERPAAALREAQLAMWKTKGWDAPYYWAAFTLQGEWK